MVGVAPDAGGRLASLTVDGTELLVRRSGIWDSQLAWGSYPMVPWAGRIRGGRLAFRGGTYDLPRNLGAHAIHGVGFTSRWQVTRQDECSIELMLALPSDARWPFGGRAHQRIEVDAGGVRLELSTTAAERPFPASLGWHPWFRKPDRIEFHPTAMYRRDRDGITVEELVDVPPGPWDDCFANDLPIVVTIDGCSLRLTSDCTEWVVYDEPHHATCIEPQTAPPDAVNFRPHVLEPGDSLAAWYRIDVVD